MSVTVRTTRSSGGRHVSVTHQKATHFQIVDGGHLVLTDRGPGSGNGLPVAVYAPGQWVDSVVEEATEG